MCCFFGVLFLIDDYNETNSYSKSFNFSQFNFLNFMLQTYWFTVVHRSFVGPYIALLRGCLGIADV